MPTTPYPNTPSRSGGPKQNGLPTPQPKYPQPPNPPAPDKYPPGRPPETKPPAGESAPPPIPAPPTTPPVPPQGPPVPPPPVVPPPPPQQPQQPQKPKKPKVPVNAMGYGPRMGGASAVLGPPAPAPVSRVPAPAALATAPAGTQYQTPVGVATATGGSTADVALSPEGQQKYREAVVAGRRELGPVPRFAALPGAPEMPFDLGRHNYNPWTGTFAKSRS